MVDGSNGFKHSGCQGNGRLSGCPGAKDMEMWKKFGTYEQEPNA